MIKSTKPPIRRIQLIHQRLTEDKYPNTVTLARELEVSRRTLLRDIEYLRDQMGAPVEYDQIKKGFYYTDKTYSFPTIQITEGELIAIFVAEKLLSQYKGTPYEESLNNAFRKISSSLPDEVAINLSGLENIYSFKSTGATVHDIEIFRKLAHAAIKNTQVEIKYHTLYRDAVSTRLVDPYHLTNHNGNWYLLAYCHDREEMRTFLVTRIKSLKETGKHFTTPSGFNPSDELNGAFGVLTGDKEHTVKLKFDQYAARYIREKVWHPTQTLVEQKDGSILLTFRLNSLTEIQSWVLSWGEHIEVKNPAELRRTIARTAQQCADNHKRK